MVTLTDLTEHNLFISKITVWRSFGPSLGKRKWLRWEFLITYYAQKWAHNDHTWWCLNRSCWWGNSANRSHDWVRKGLVDASWSSTFLLQLLLLPFELFIIFLHIRRIKLWDGVTRFDDWRGALYWRRRRGLRLWQQGQIWSQNCFNLYFLLFPLE